MRDFLRRFPLVCLCNGNNSSGSTILSLQLEINQEDVNGENLTMKKWWIFGADFSQFTQSFSWFIRDINGEKKHLVIDDLFHG